MNPAPTTTEDKSPVTSRGEGIFDWLVYGGIAGLGAFIVTIPVTYWAKHGGGARHFQWAGQALEKMGFSAKTAEQTVMTTALMQGGNLAVIPVKWTEDHKIAFVKKINDINGEKTDIEALQQEDKQTWRSIIKARILAWSAAFIGIKGAAHIFGEQKFAAFEDAFAKHMVCKPLGKPTHILGKESVHFKLGKIAALDVFATAAASALLYIGSRYFAHVNKTQAAPEMVEEKAVLPVQEEPLADKPMHAPMASKRSTASVIKNKRPMESFTQAVTQTSADSSYAGLSA